MKSLKKHISESFDNSLVNEAAHNSLYSWFLVQDARTEAELIKAGVKAGFKKEHIKTAVDDFQQGDDSYIEWTKKIISSKLMKENINESKELSLDAAIKLFEKSNLKGDANDLGIFCYKNYGKLTGEPQSSRDEEQDFPELFYSMAKKLGFSDDDFQDAYDAAAG